MENLTRYEFKCPMCGKEKVTLVTPTKLTAILRREKLMQEIFSPEVFPNHYREIFISGYCSECQGMLFGSPQNKKDYCDVDIDEKTDNLEITISEMYQNDK